MILGNDKILVVDGKTYVRVAAVSQAFIQGLTPEVKSFVDKVMEETLDDLLIEMYNDAKKASP